MVLSLLSVGLSDFPLPSSQRQRKNYSSLRPLRLCGELLPKVYVVVPDIQVEKYARIFSPRLANPEQVIDFNMEVTGKSSSATL
jgi:hypothetical protein